MTADEKQILKDLFEKLKSTWYQNQVNHDMIEKILRKMPEDTITPQGHADIEKKDWGITEAQLTDLEDRINNLQ